MGTRNEVEANEHRLQAGSCRSPVPERGLRSSLWVLRLSRNGAVEYDFFGERR
jgi:hypothetical protein